METTLAGRKMRLVVWEELHATDGPIIDGAGADRLTSFFYVKRVFLTSEMA